MHAATQWVVDGGKRDACQRLPPPSLGSLVFPSSLGLSCQEERRNLPWLTTRARREEEERLDSDRATLPLIALKMEFRGEGSIPDIPGVAGQKVTEYHRFITFARSAPTPRVITLRITLCGQFVTSREGE